MKSIRFRDPRDFLSHLILKMNVPTSYLVLGGSVVVMLYFINQRPVDPKESEAFKKGYAAGFFTPGPFTVLGILGAGYYISQRK